MHKDLMQAVKKGDFSGLDMVHHLSAGFKAVFTRITYDGIDQVRQSCGGAGFSAFSGLPMIQADFAPNTTLEGDNTVMLQQVAKLIFKTQKQAMKGKKPSGIFSYFNEIEQLLSARGNFTKAEDFMCLVNLNKALAVRAAFKVKHTLTQLAQSKATENEKINTLFASDIVQMSHSHMIYVVFQIFMQKIATIQCPKVKAHLEDMARIFALHQLVLDSSPCYESQFFSLGCSQLIQDALKKMFVKVRPQLIPLIESFGIDDTQIVSSIGNSYGDIYETQLEWAKNSRLNKSPVAKGFDEYIKPILQGKL